MKAIKSRPSGVGDMADGTGEIFWRTQEQCHANFFTQLR